MMKFKREKRKCPKCKGVGEVAESCLYCFGVGTLFTKRRI